MAVAWLTCDKSTSTVSVPIADHFLYRCCKFMHIIKIVLLMQLVHKHDQLSTKFCISSYTETHYLVTQYTESHLGKRIAYG